MEKIIPHLWFDNQAEEAVRFYTSIFKNLKIGYLSYYGDSGSEISGRPKGSVLTISFELNGQEFMALNAGPLFKFNESISFMILCEDQNEMDYFYENLSAVPEAEQCGWIKDKFGLSWQIVPKQLSRLINSSDKIKAEKVRSGLLKMKRLNIGKLIEIYEE